MHVIGVRAGDVILASTFTFIGSVAAAHHMGAELVFLDSDAETWCVDPALLEAELNYRQTNGEKMPKALILTHLYGQSAKLREIKAICEKYSVMLVEDAAESLGCTYDNKHTGTFGDLGIYSFNGNKILTTSGGGVLVSDNAAYINKAKFLSTQAKEDYEYYQHEEVGYNYRMSNVLAAIGVGQMEVIDERVKRCREIFDIYVSELASDKVKFMPELLGTRGNRWLTTITLDSIEPKKIIMALKNDNIEARSLWKPMHMQPVFKKNRAKLNGISENLFNTGLCLPSGSIMTNNDLERVIAIVKKEIS